MLRAPVLLSLLTLALPSCTYFTGDPYVVVTSTPAGAEVWVDGEPTGKTTPTRLDLGGILGSDHEITIKREGFVEETRNVFHYTTGYTSRWIDGAADPADFAFFLDWTFGDVFLPFGVKWRYVPHELHIQMYAPGQGPVKASDLEDQ